MDGQTAWNVIPYPMPDTKGITVLKTSIEDRLVMNIYFPPGHEPESKTPVIVNPQVFKKNEELQQFGRSVMSFDYEVSWAHLMAAQGWVVLKCESTAPSKSIEETLRFVQENHKNLGVNPDKVGFWTVSSNPQGVIGFLSYGPDELKPMIACSTFLSP
ncbi:MAG: hypothetical protein PQJ61_13105 [Spirochaetales bacterium]|uniref:Uncharacterized protein n=1 Tax=Candidatus Thalassospirochaeta sargassi TaxID=3119039 RepID=A0AAJ1IIH3_9SPIO|nr:hypothetical protein [Spirochaetales bacterium]